MANCAAPARAPVASSCPIRAQISSSKNTASGSVSLATQVSPDMAEPQTLKSTSCCCSPAVPTNPNAIRPWSMVIDRPSCATSAPVPRRLSSGACTGRRSNEGMKHARWDGDVEDRPSCSVHDIRSVHLHLNPKATAAGWQSDVTWPSRVEESRRGAVRRQGAPSDMTAQAGGHAPPARCIPSLRPEPHRPRARASSSRTPRATSSGMRCSIQ